MPKFKAEGQYVFQLPEENNGTASMGFRICECDNGAGVPEDDATNASIIADSLNLIDDLKPFLHWINNQKTLYLNKQRRALIERLLK